LRHLITGATLFIVAQAMIWFQTNGQFIWPIFKRLNWLVAFGFGGLISLIVIRATAETAEAFDGQLWPGRFIASATGLMTFTILTYLFMGESVNLKTGVSLILAVALILVQILWK
jgi:hypothetical protein